MTTWDSTPAHFVYFMQHPVTGLVKIGCAGWPKLRIKELSSLHRVSLELLAYAPGDFGEERRMHALFADERVDGEWFSPSEGVLTAIEHVRNTGALPPPSGETREDEIVRRRRAGEPIKAIAGDFGLSRTRVCQIIHEEEVAEKIAKRRSGTPTILVASPAPSQAAA